MPSTMTAAMEMGTNGVPLLERGPVSMEEACGVLRSMKEAGFDPGVLAGQGPEDQENRIAESVFDLAYTVVELHQVLLCERGLWSPPQEGWVWEVDTGYNGYWINRDLLDANGWPVTIRRMTPTGWSSDGVTRSDTAYDAMGRAKKVGTWRSGVVPSLDGRASIG